MIYSRPIPPVLQEYRFTPVEGGYFITQADANAMLHNTKELKRYNEQLLALVEQYEAKKTLKQDTQP